MTSSRLRQFLSTVFSVKGRNSLLTRIGVLGNVIVEQVARDAFYTLQVLPLSSPRFSHSPTPFFLSCQCLILQGNRTADTAQRFVSDMQNWVLRRAIYCAKRFNVTLPPL